MFVQPEEEPEELIAARAKLDSASLAQQENEPAGVLKACHIQGSYKVLASYQGCQQVSALLARSTTACADIVTNSMHCTIVKLM